MGACGGGDEGGVTPTGPHYKYVVNKIGVPTGPGQSAQFGLDLNGDGSVDNKIGDTIAFLSNLANIQAAIDTGVLNGKLILLADVQTPSFTSSDGTGIQFFLGDNPQPAACSNASDTVTCTNAKPSVCMGCGKHLSNGTFSVAAASPRDPAIAGKITGGTFTGGPGTMTLLMSFGDAAPIRFDLVQARVKATGIAETTIGTVSGSSVTDGLLVGGIVTQASMDSAVFPGLADQLTANIKKDCPAAVPPSCTCDKQKELLAFVKKMPYTNCDVSKEEVKAAAAGILPPDLTVDGKPAYSAGIKAAAVKATFAAPGE